MGRRPLLAIVGAADAPSQDTSQLTPVGLMAEAAACALEGTSLAKADIDGLFSASSYYYLPTLTISEYLQIRPTYSDTTTLGGCSFIAHLRHAANAIAAGQLTVGLIAHSSTQRTDGNRFVKSMSESLSYEVPYGPLWPITGYAMMAQRHMHQFGTTSAQLAEVAVAARQWALLNPSARQTKPLTIDDVLASPMVSDPLHRLDCCLVTNGGGALIVTSPERAADLCEKPVYVWGAAEGHDSRHVSGMPDFVTSPARFTGPAALAEAGVGLDDIDVFQLYDSFTIANIVTLEDLGFCEKGEGGPFVEDGRLRPGGKLAVNTGGGGLSYRHPGMLGMVLLLEAITQLRGEGGPRQIGGAETALVHGLGAVHMSGATAVLGGPDWRPGR
jgi:acetyl-CoA acetyltransferase